MIKKGKVLKIEGKHVLIAPDSGEHCFGCMEIECKSRISSIDAKNSKALPLEPGQTVELKFIKNALLKQAATTLLPPIPGFLIGFFLAYLSLPNASQAAHVFSGIIFFFASAFIVYRIKKKHPAEENPLYIERVINRNFS
ncbi:MAG: SoxR reducing system RseC family protein [Treponema sp.]|nr:SoxR reducing system RseC family protein [Treponema sp.]